MIKNSKKAFTLTEVVIACAIIGIISALTIPSYLANSAVQKNQYVAGLKKAYAEFDYATQQIKANNSGTLVGIFSSPDVGVTSYCKYMKCAKTCIPGSITSGGCFNAYTSIKTLNNITYWSNYDAPGGESSGLLLADGTMVYLWVPGGARTACNFSANTLTTICAAIFVDVNGAKGPNVLGREMFSFWVLKNGLIPQGSIDDLNDYNTYCNTASGNIYDGQSCAGRVLKEGKMLY